MVFGHEAPVAAVGRVVPIVTLHPIVIHLEGIFVGLLSVDEYLALGGNLEVIPLIGSDGTFVDGQILQGELQGLSLLGYPDGAIVVTGPARVGILWIEGSCLAVVDDGDIGHHILPLLQGLLGSLGERQNARLIVVSQVILADAQVLYKGGRKRLSHQFHLIVVLYVFGIRVHLSVQIHDSVLDLECLSRQAHTALHIVLSAVHGACVYMPEVSLVHAHILLAQVVYLAVEIPLLQGSHASQLRQAAMLLFPQLSAYTIAERVILGLIRHLGDDGISGRIVEDHYVVQFDGLGTHTLVVPLGPLDVALASTQYIGQGVLHHGHMERCLRYTWTVGHLVDHQIIAHQKALLQRTAGDVVVLEEIGVEEVYCYQREYDGIHPAHDGTGQGVLEVLPPRPGNPAGDVGIQYERYHDDSPPGIHPVEKAQV